MAKQSSTIETNVPASDNTDVQAMLDELRRELEAKNQQIAELSTAKKAKTPKAPKERAVRAAPTLESVVARQSKTPAKWAILQVAAFALDRMATGQSEADALDGVTRQIYAIAEDFLHNRNEKSLMLACWDYMAANYPSTVIPRTGKKGTAASDAAASDGSDSEAAAEDSAASSEDGTLAETVS